LHYQLVQQWRTEEPAGYDGNKYGFKQIIPSECPVLANETDTLLLTEDCKSSNLKLPDARKRTAPTQQPEPKPVTYILTGF
jgi:hypothetical protein